MSAKATFWAWAIDLEVAPDDRLTTNEKMVLLRLADHANNDGIAWPGKDSLAHACCMSKRSVDRAIESLAHRQLLSIKRRESKPGKSQSNVYALNYQQGRLFSPGELSTGVSQVQGCQSDTPVTHDQLGVSHSPTRGVTVTPESTNESIKESTISKKVKKSAEQTEKLPPSIRELQNWADKNNGPPYRTGETPEKYRKRLDRWNYEGRKTVGPYDNPMMDLPGNLDQVRQAVTEEMNQ